MRLSRTLGLILAASLSLTVAACSSSPASEHSDHHAGAFATIEHVYGTTVIPKKPERVASVAWGNNEVALALGVVPVGMAKMTYGDDDGNGVYPWVEDKLKALDAKTPVLFDETDGINFEAVADTKPDVILAAFSGITKEEYETLSKIAPVVAYPSIAWGTSLEQTIEMNSKAIGKEAEGQELVKDLRTKSESTLASFPELQNKKVLFASVDPSDLSKLSVFTLPDTRPGFLRDLGLPQPKLMDTLPKDNTRFFVEVSSEDADRLNDADVFAVYGDTKGKLLKQLQADPLLSKIPAIKNGHVAVIPDNTPLAAMANPSALSLDWGLKKYLGILADATGTKQ
ncbi:iron-siderophore ABC transporter substrate-binding protein [Leucobacter sp. CSA2]|uniref:Iron-siderophore ABC transporter substrate-binding protein n=1 Tax=Leucobacter edaphi TaxID=2796472 RepID=A0A934QC97_9MICO|nr:iron-siderophore ABC transporter substrate-binding protein [Leucobacter edaphi]MBK0421808.1 iron-siderophore ABC transporter substrate-binding protein [Leucobacter edaphi]